MSDREATRFQSGTLSLPGNRRQRRRYRFCVFIGRMRPPTRAHVEDVAQALALGDIAIVEVGSARQARGPRNPLKPHEVEMLLRGNFSDEDNARLVFVYMPDSYNNQKWISRTRRAVQDVVRRFKDEDEENPSIAILGHKKDETSSYISMFPGWQEHLVPNIDGISATPIRDDYYLDPAGAVERFRDHLPPNVAEWLLRFAQGPDYAWLAAEAADDLSFKEPYKGLKHPPMFNEALAVVVQSGHVLVAERSLRPRKGLLTLPGTIMRAHETAEETMLRAVVEKTRIRLSPDTLSALVTHEQRFDYPWRSERGRFVAHGFLIELRDEAELPKVSGDRKKGTADAAWIPVDDIDPETMVDDHANIVETLYAYAGRKRR